MVPRSDVDHVRGGEGQDQTLQPNEFGHLQKSLNLPGDNSVYRTVLDVAVMR
jgi:hypothetical protein